MLKLGKNRKVHISTSECSDDSDAGTGSDVEDVLDHGESLHREDAFPTCLHDDPLLPIHKTGLKRGLATKKAVETLLHPRAGVIAKAVPCSVSTNAAFVVDLSAPLVKRMKNLMADDLGAWTPTVTKQHFYRALSKRNPALKVPQEEYDADPRVYRCTRSFYRNKSSTDPKDRHIFDR